MMQGLSMVVRENLEELNSFLALRSFLPRTGSDRPGTYTVTFSAWRLLNVSPPWLLHASLRVFINSRFFQR
jgi:hypothetical protein